MIFAAVDYLLNKFAPNRIATLSRKEILAKFGEPDLNYQRKYMMLWEIQKDFQWFPAEKVFINKQFKEQLNIAFIRLQAESLQKQIKTFDGCFEVRMTRGTNLPSLHSWGMAIDLNSSIEKLGQKETNFSERFIQIMCDHVYWGGNFVSRKDNMHFGLYNE